MTGTLYVVGRKAKRYNHFAIFIKLNIYLPYGPAIPPVINTQEKRKLMFIQKRVCECLQQFSSPLPQTGKAQCEWINWGTPTQQNTTQQQKGTRLLLRATIWMHLKCIFLCENSRSGKRRPGVRDKRVQRRVWPPRRSTGSWACVELGGCTWSCRARTMWATRRESWHRQSSEEPTRWRGEPEMEYRLGQSNLATSPK